MVKMMIVMMMMVSVTLDYPGDGVVYSDSPTKFSDWQSVD